MAGHKQEGHDLGQLYTKQLRSLALNRLGEGRVEGHHIVHEKMAKLRTNGTSLWDQLSYIHSQ